MTGLRSLGTRLNHFCFSIVLWLRRFCTPSTPFWRLCNCGDGCTLLSIWTRQWLLLETSVFFPVPTPVANWCNRASSCCSRSLRFLLDEVFLSLPITDWWAVAMSFVFHRWQKIVLLSVVFPPSRQIWSLVQWSPCTMLLKLLLLGSTAFIEITLWLVGLDFGCKGFDTQVPKLPWLEQCVILMCLF